MFNDTKVSKANATALEKSKSLQQELASTSPEKPILPQLSNVDEAILIVMSSRELYGLQIVEAFNEASDGSRTINPGTLYPILTRLEVKKLISSRLHDGSTLAKGGSRRKLFKITDSGLLALSETQRFRNELRQWEPAYGTAVYA
jgi:PadR family transcriptional regulator, regulatory protein PadR